MPNLWDRFSSSSSSSSSSLSRTPTPNQPPRSAWGSAAREEGLGRCASLESSDCESLDSSNSGFGPEEDSAYLDGVSLPDFELLSDPEDEHLCASQSLTLSTGFRVIKKKLYSSEQLLIEEC